MHNANYGSTVHQVKTNKKKCLLWSVARYHDSYSTDNLEMWYEYLYSTHIFIYFKEKFSTWQQVHPFILTAVGIIRKKMIQVERQQ